VRLVPLVHELAIWAQDGHQIATIEAARPSAQSTCEIVSHSEAAASEIGARL
jgi:hypothetical protein